MWLNKLKIAISEKNTDAINLLLDKTPELKDTKEVEQAMYLLREVAELLYTLKDETADSMKQIRKNLQFLRSTEVKASTKLDITS